MTTVKIRQITLLIGDVAVMYIALAFMLLIRYGGSEMWAQYALHIAPMSLVFAVWAIILYVNGLYDLFLAKPSLALYRRFYESLFVGLAIAVGMFYLLPIFSITPKTNLFILTACFALLFMAWRALMGVSQNATIRLLAVNPNKEILELLETLKKNPQFGYDIVGYIGEGVSAPKNITRFMHDQPLRALIAEHRVGMVIVNSEKHSASDVNQELYELLFWNVHVIPAAHFFEELTGRVPVSSLDEAWFFENLETGRMVVHDITRRILDCIVGFFGFIAMCLLLPILALLLKWRSPGPIFYKQERVGQNGRRFNVYKFRTMHVLGADGGAEVRGAQITRQNDPRVSHFGGFIRRLRLDELPQMINILAGNMSLIGPRPERPEFVHKFEKYMPYYTVRHLVKPGLTGWAQINYPYAETTEQQLTKFQYDLYYVKNRSVFMDLAIALKTFHVVLYRKGR